MKSLGADANGTEQFIDANADGDIVLTTTYANTAPILDRNAQLRLAGSGTGKEMRLAASIPPSLIQKWRVEHGVDIFSNDPWHRQRSRDLLNSNEYYKLRIWGGNL